MHLDTQMHNYLLRLILKMEASFHYKDRIVKALKCGDNQTINYTIPAGEALSNITVKCVILDINGTRLESQNKTIDVLRSYVAFENSTYVFNIGENASLTCEIENFENWNQIEIWRPNNRLLLRYNKTVDRRITVLQSDSRVSFIGSKSNINDSSGKIKVEISPVSCNDSEGRIGAVDYVCRVVNTEANAERNGTTRIQFQRLPKKPELIMSREIIEGRWTFADRAFICKGDVGNPPGHIEIETDFNGSYSTFLALFPGQNKTDLGIIVNSSYSDATVPSENCGLDQIIGFGFEKVLFDFMAFKHVRCVTKPSSDLKNGLTLYSNEEIIKIIPADYCKNNVVDHFHKPHPYFCHLAVECDGSGRITGVPGPCLPDHLPCAVTTSEGKFYCETCDKVTCLPPDIFCDQTTISSYESSSVVYNCEITEVGSVSHVSVNNHSASIASQNDTLQLWNNVVVSIKDGHLTLEISNVSCLDEGKYTVKFNNKSSVALVLKVLTKPEEPTLLLPDIINVNQEVNVTCSGKVGRDQYGKNLSAIYLEVNLTGSTGFTMFSFGEKRSGLTERDCQISESVQYTFIADHQWNNSYVRCVARNSTDIVSASAQKHLILQTPGIYCDAVMKTAKISDSISFSCYLKDITNISRLSVRDNTSELLNVQSKVPPFSEVKDDFNLTMVSVDEILVNFTNITCTREGEYTIKVNDATSAKFKIRIISDPVEPTLNRPFTGALNMQYNVTCSGSLGRDSEGKPVTSMQLLVKFANESGFTVYNKSIIREAVSYASCLNNETIRLILYPDETWNNTVVRCAVMNSTNAVKYSTEQPLIFGSADIYFNETAPIGYVGESLILTCVVENMPRLSDIIIKKGNGRTEVAKLTTNYTIDGTKIIYADSRIVNNTGVLKINMTVKCGDDKDYYCTASGSGSETPSEDVLSVAVYWKASKPVLDPSSDMVENSAPWVGTGFDTRCTGELGFNNASIYMQVKHSDGTVINITTTVVTSSYDVKMCLNKQTIKFNQQYTSSWNGSIIRCIVDTGKETYVDAEYVRVVPATYCDDVNVLPVTKPHPFDCRAFFTCVNDTKNIIPQRPNAQCTVDECYNVNDPSKCVSCGDKCRPDPLQDALPHMICEDKTAKVGSYASVICTLYNIMVENVSSPSILIIRQSSVWFNTKNMEPVTSSVSEATFNVSTGIQLIVRKANVELKFLSGPLCADEGDFTFQYDGKTAVQDTSKITVQSDPGRPELSKTPENFYRGQEMTLTCSGSIGKPKSTLSLKRKSPTDGQFEVVQGVVIENDIYDSATCAFNRTLSYSFVVSSSLENTTYKCETTGSNGTSYSSSNETVKIQNALVGFANDSETAEIGLQKQIQCVLINYDGQSRVNISRQTLAGKEDICSVDNNNLVLRTEGFNCTAHTDGNKGIMTVNILVVSCETEGTYYCESLGMKGSMQLSVKRNASKPVLKLPQDNAVIENVAIPQADPIVCTADVGYPANGKELKIQYKLNNSDVFVDFLTPTVVTDCTQNATVTTTYNTMLNRSHDGASFRCGIFENGSISSESPVKTLRVISNDCPSTLNVTTSVYLPHPLNCRKYIWCYSSGIAVQSCPGAGCFNITAAATAAGGLCDDMSCGNATCTSG